MDSEGRDERDEERESRRPRVVDKRVSSRGAAAPSSEPVEPPASEPIATPPPREEPVAPPDPTPSPTPDPSTATEAHGHPDTDAPQTGPGGRVWTPEEEAEAQRAAQEMAAVPARDWVLNVAVTLANVAGVKLQDGQMAEAQLAIDAFSGMVEKIETQMGEAAPVLRQTLAQLQMAYAQSAGPPPQTPGE